MKFRNRMLKYGAVAIAVVGSSQAMAIDTTVITGSVDFADIILGMLAVGGAVAGANVAWRGIKMLTSGVKSL